MDTEHFMALLREQGYKVTPQRLAIFETVLSSHDHPTAEQIYQRVINRNPAISRATVYHALHLLKELRLVQELGVPGGSSHSDPKNTPHDSNSSQFDPSTTPRDSKGSRFDPNTTPHVNVICPRCGEVYDYDRESIAEFWSQIASELNVEPIGHRMDLYAICMRCNDKQD